MNRTTVGWRLGLAALLALAAGCFRNTLSTIELDVPAMKSEACAQAVRDAVAKLGLGPDGAVRDVRADVAARKAWVTYDNVRQGRRIEGRAVLQIAVEERQQHVAPPLCRRVAIPVEHAQRRAVIIGLAVPPRPHDEEVFVVVLVLAFHRRVAVDRTPHVLLVPQPLQPHRRHLEWRVRHGFVECLLAPELVVGRMLGDLAPETELVESRRAREISGRTGAQEVVVVVEAGTHDLLAFPARRGLP